MEIIFKDRTLHIASTEGKIDVIVGGYANSAFVSVTACGLEEKKKFLSEDLRLGDTVRIRLSQTENSSEPEKVTRKDREALIREYNSLKGILSSKGLI